MNTQTWIKRSEREPTVIDLPLVCGRYIDAHWSEHTYFHQLPLEQYTHWRSIKCDPPQRELTQRERDREYALNLARLSCRSAMDDILEAVYAERREVAKLLAEHYGDSGWGVNMPSVAVYSTEMCDLRARLDEQGEK